MNYQFPIIHTIYDVLPHIEGCKDFIVVDKGDYTVINYVVAGNDTFPPPVDLTARVRRECRGIIFDSGTGLILRRPYHKFFNLGEREECLPVNLDFSTGHYIMDKLDGSMIVPFIAGGKLIWGTKMGATEVSAPVQEYCEKNQNLTDYARFSLSIGYTPIFEWCSPKNQIVIKHSEDRLVLTAIRHTIRGDYLPIQLDIAAFQYGIEVCRYYSGGVQDLQKFISDVRNETDREGYVIRWNDGHMVKVKCDWYVNIHKIKEEINSERSVLNLYFGNKFDDAMALLSQEEKDRIGAFNKVVYERMEKFAADTFRQYMEAKRVLKLDRKQFALQLAPRLPDLQRALIFKVYDEDWVYSYNTFYVMLREQMIKSLTNNQSYEKVKNQVFKDVVY
jgi:RNA ligase